jgi:putative transcriptional regulator
MTNRLRSIRKARGLKLRELAKLTGWGLSTISNYEKGRFEASADLLDKLSKILGVTIEQIQESDLTPATSGGIMRDSGPAAVPESYDEVLKRRLAEAACGIRGGFGIEESLLALDDIVRDAKALKERYKKQTER